MASLGSYLPEGGRAVWRRDRQPEYAQESQAVRHIVIRGTEVVPHPSPHVVYRIDVLTEHSHWYVCRRYSEFHDLHRKLIRHHKISRDLLPPKKLSGNFTPQLINGRRKQLEDYLQKLINSEPQVSQSQDLLIFLDLPAHDVVHVTELLARQLYSLGDKLLEQATPIALTINDLHCITKRLRLPMDLQHSTDAAGDLGHLYSFIHQIHSLKVIQPPPPSSVTRMAFEVSPFRSLTILKIDSVPLTQVSGLVRIQQQLQKITAQRCLKSLRELLIDSVEERRPGAETQPFTDSWRLVATAKFTSNRVVIQPWHKLTYLNISQNKLTYLDDSLQVLPALKELNISHNLLVSIDLQHLCLPTLTSVNLSYNNISLIISRQLVLEGLKDLNISHNSLTDLAPLVVFIGLRTLNISYNKIASRDDFVYLSQLKTLVTLTIKGNPIMTNSAARLVLLARFMHKSRMVSVDGLEATSREQAKIRSLTEKYGPNTDQWPVIRRVQSISSPSHQPLPQSPPPPAESPPTVHVSWSIESIKRVPTSTISDTSPSHSLSTTTDGSYCNSIDHPLFYDTTLSIKTSSLPSSRDDPDGRSDVSTHSSDAIALASSPSPLVLPTPPCTPLSPGEGIRQSSQSSVTPQMISAALEALTQAASHASTPTDEAQLPELLSQALHNFITEQACATPPSTPLNQDELMEEQPISSADFISALTTALSIHCETNRGLSSGSGSTIPSVPVGTPQEGLSELAKLGIQPESILQALNSLSCQSREEITIETSDEEDEPVATITNHNVSKSLTILDDNNEKSSPHLISSDERGSSRPVYSDPTPRKYSQVIDIAVPLI